ncbi:MAG: NAD(+)/NADH kinase [Lachnospiraceae bacterium]|nr:NAD(+)/NADH kinase [Lachnospiraceae bacterium]
MNNFLILANSDKDVNLSLSNKISEYLRNAGAKVVIVCDVGESRDECTIKEELMEGVQAAIVLGGDGTMLRAAHSIGTYNIPFIGINLGTLGFLTEIEESNVCEALDRLLKDDYIIEERMMIEGSVKDKVFDALNDVVITRAGFSRIIGLKIYVNNQLLDTYGADGVILATPTGSTGYNMSAGGPIVSPKASAIVVTPISPHSLTSKSIVFDSTEEIRVEIMKKRKTQETEAIVSFDGENNIELSAGDCVNVKLSARSISLIKMYDVNFYSVLREKIGG